MVYIPYHLATKDYFLGDIYIPQEVVGWLPGGYIYRPGSQPTTSWGYIYIAQEMLAKREVKLLPFLPAQLKKGRGGGFTTRWSRTWRVSECHRFKIYKHQWDIRRGCNRRQWQRHVRIRPSTKRILCFAFQRSFIATSFANGCSKLIPPALKATCCPAYFSSSCSSIVQGEIFLMNLICACCSAQTVLATACVFLC